MSKQLTSVKTCKHKHTYHSATTATRAKKRRNKAAGYNYLRTYQCNVCEKWHVTAQVDELNHIKGEQKMTLNEIVHTVAMRTMAKNIYVDLDGTLHPHKCPSEGLWHFDGQFYYLPKRNSAQ